MIRNWKKAAYASAAALTVTTALAGLLVHMTGFGAAPADRSVAVKPPVHMTSAHRV
ncbi:Uncharacterised protein [Actinomadura madurae]|nr:Uncharacterised protein [Actinomadura madurae]